MRLLSVLPLHALFSLAMMIRMESFDWVTFHAVSYQKKKKKEVSDQKNLWFFSEAPPLSLTHFLIMQHPIFVARWHEVITIHSSCPCFTTFTCCWKWHSRTQIPLEVLSEEHNRHTVFSKSQNPLCCGLSYWDFSQDGCKMDCLIIF